MVDFFTALAAKIKKNTTALENYGRIFVPPAVPLRNEEHEPIRVNILFKHIQVSILYCFCVLFYFFLPDKGFFNLYLFFLPDKSLLQL
jgi:hypothetical protein